MKMKFMYMVIPMTVFALLVVTTDARRKKAGCVPAQTLANLDEDWVSRQTFKIFV
jgi:hypothetical protein